MYKVRGKEVTPEEFAFKATVIILDNLEYVEAMVKENPQEALGAIDEIAEYIESIREDIQENSEIAQNEHDQLVEQRLA